ncbi:MAG: OmpA family protein [Acidobacteriota bacterium]
MRTLPRLSVVLLAGAWLATSPARADLGFPDSVKLPPQIQVDPDQSLIQEDMAEAEFPADASGSKTVTKRGRHYARWFVYKPAAGEPAPGYYNGTEGRIYNAIQPLFARGGWQTVWTSDDKSSFSMRLAKGGMEAWAKVRMDAPQAQVFLEVIETGSAAAKLELPAPAAAPEKIGDNADIPYLPPYPGSTRKGGGRDDGPLILPELAKAGGEPAAVGQGVLSRSYQGPKTLSKLQFVADYRDALTRAGWKVLYPATDAQAAEAGTLVAHYAKNGRDVWAHLFYEYGASLSYTIADVGAEDWAAKLDRDCRLPLYGVLFDFNKSSLKPDSEPVLAKAASLLKAKAFTVEVQGHTDNVGADAYNLQLSEARAASVKAWLVQHGVAADHLSSKGYGKTQPVADNGSDEGRAKNRRVELVKAGCKPAR